MVVVVGGKSNIDNAMAGMVWKNQNLSGNNVTIVTPTSQYEIKIRR